MKLFPIFTSVMLLTINIISPGPNWMNLTIFLMSGFVLGTFVGQSEWARKPFGWLQ